MGGKARASRRTSQGPEPFAPASPQALSLKESEKTALSEKLMGTQHSLAAVSLEMERQKRDAQSRQEQDRVGRGPGGEGFGLGRGPWGGVLAEVGVGAWRRDCALWQLPGCAGGVTLPWGSPLGGRAQLGPVNP